MGHPVTHPNSAAEAACILLTSRQLQPGQCGKLLAVVRHLDPTSSSAASDSRASLNLREPGLSPHNTDIQAKILVTTSRFSKTRSLQSSRSYTALRFSATIHIAPSIPAEIHQLIPTENQVQNTLG